MQERPFSDIITPYSRILYARFYTSYCRTVYPRFLESPIRRALVDTRVVAIAGPRQSGKSTLARAIAGIDAPYLSLDEATTFAAAKDDPTGFVRRTRGFTVIDEIQRVPELMLAIKLAVDENQQPGRFLITGSADIRTLPTIQDSLAGRIEVFELLPLARDEIIGRRSTFLVDVFAGQLPPPGESLEPEALQRVVATGGFPEALTRSGRVRRGDWFRAYARAIVEQDVLDVANLDRRRDMPQLVAILAQHCSEMINLTQIGAQLGMDRKTVQRHIAVLEQLFLVRRVRPWFRNELLRLSKTPKLHFVDCGLAAVLRRLDVESLGPDRTALGPIIETFVFSELSKQVSWSDEPPDILHYRDHDGGEIDFILESWDRRVVAIEVKAGATVRREAFRTMRKVSETLGDAFVLGVVLYDGTQRVQFGDKLWAVPISSLWGSSQ